MAFEISDVDLGWVAGLIEGEGCFYVGRTKKEGWLVTQVIVVMNDREPLDRLCALVGGAVSGPYVRRANVNPSHEWSIHGQRQVELIFAIYDLMSERRREKMDALLEARRQSPVKRVREGAQWPSSTSAAG